ncbi:MAG TPA: preprotein translocase subunit YajC [Propionibacteriaceae bacterium]|nr:preprotein translocase subunit YajC [Propionibacteriaceae bacterium]
MANSSFSTLVLIGLMVFAFYFLILRPQRKRQQSLQRTMGELGPGSRVMLGSGLFGTVLSVGEKQVVLEISPGAELTVLKQAISRVVTEADEDVEEPDDELDDEVTDGQQTISPATAPEVTPHENGADQPGDPRTGPTGVKE